MTGPPCHVDCNNCHYFAHWDFVAQPLPDRKEQ